MIKRKHKYRLKQDNWLFKKGTIVVALENNHGSAWCVLEDHYDPGKHYTHDDFNTKHHDATILTRSILEEVQI